MNSKLVTKFGTGPKKRTCEEIHAHLTLPKTLNNIEKESKRIKRIFLYDEKNSKT